MDCLEIGVCYAGVCQVKGVTVKRCHETMAFVCRFELSRLRLGGEGMCIQYFIYSKVYKNCEVCQIKGMDGSENTDAL